MARTHGLGFLGTCKAIRHETITYFYSSTFRIDCVQLPPPSMRKGPFAFMSETHDARHKPHDLPLKAFSESMRVSFGLDKRYGLKAVKELVFAYYQVDPLASQAGVRPKYIKNPLLPEKADLVATFRFLEKSLTSASRLTLR